GSARVSGAALQAQALREGKASGLARLAAGPMKTRLCLAVIVLANAFGNVLLTRGMREVGDIASYSPLELVVSGAAALANPWVLGGVALLLVFFVAHALALSWTDLSYVLL